MRGFIDLHSHWVPSIDDGVRSYVDGERLLAGLYGLGFSTVIATPHMRSGMFDNDRPSLEKAFGLICKSLKNSQFALPEVHLASEHFFDDVVYSRILRNEALPYPGERAILIEFNPEIFPTFLVRRLFDVMHHGLIPVIAHPERYRPVWNDDTCLDPLIDAGACLLLDLCSLVGKYGRASQKAAEKLLAEDAYEAACSDAHKSEDVDAVAAAMKRLTELVGTSQTTRLLRDGPRSILGAATIVQPSIR